MTCLIIWTPKLWSFGRKKFGHLDVQSDVISTSKLWLWGRKKVWEILHILLLHFYHASILSNINPHTFLQNINYFPQLCYSIYCRNTSVWWRRHELTSLINLGSNGLIQNYLASLLSLPFVNMIKKVLYLTH